MTNKQNLNTRKDQKVFVLIVRMKIFCTLQLGIGIGSFRDVKIPGELETSLIEGGFLPSTIMFRYESVLPLGQSEKITPTAIMLITRIVGKSN